MKPIIVDMKDMSDSTEVYNSRPNPFFCIFHIPIIRNAYSCIMLDVFFQNRHQCKK